MFIYFLLASINNANIILLFKKFEIWPVGRNIDYGLQLTESTTLDEIEELYFNSKINFDSDKLLNSGPWNFEENYSMFFSEKLVTNE